MKIEKLTDTDIGKWVVYKGSEKGKIKSFSNERSIAYVVYNANYNRDGDHWKDYTAASTKFEDLDWK